MVVPAEPGALHGLTGRQKILAVRGRIGRDKIAPGVGTVSTQWASPRGHFRILDEALVGRTAVIHEERVGGAYRRARAAAY